MSAFERNAAVMSAIGLADIHSCTTHIRFGVKRTSKRQAAMFAYDTQSGWPAMTFMILSKVTTVVSPMNEIYSRVVFSISVHKNVIRNETWIFNVQE
jgi:hypothetical protein